jgi:hypothetical protein
VRRRTCPSYEIAQTAYDSRNRSRSLHEAASHFYTFQGSGLSVIPGHLSLHMPATASQTSSLVFSITPMTQSKMDLAKTLSFASIGQRYARSVGLDIECCSAPSQDDRKRFEVSLRFALDSFMMRLETSHTMSSDTLSVTENTDHLAARRRMNAPLGTWNVESRIVIEMTYWFGARVLKMRLLAGGLHASDGRIGSEAEGSHFCKQEVSVKVAPRSDTLVSDGSGIFGKLQWLPTGSDCLTAIASELRRFPSKPKEISLSTYYQFCRLFVKERTEEKVVYEVTCFPASRSEGQTPEYRDPHPRETQFLRSQIRNRPKFNSGPKGATAARQ